MVINNNPVSITAFINLTGIVFAPLPDDLKSLLSFSIVEEIMSKSIIGRLKKKMKSKKATLPPTSQGTRLEVFVTIRNTVLRAPKKWDASLSTDAGRYTPVTTIQERV
jgi:hypothetical protein